MGQSPSSVEYNTKAIRELVQTAFTDEEFWIFCYDHFPAVYQKFSTGMTYTHKVHLLIEYCGQSNSFGRLLRLVKAFNPNKYAQSKASLHKKPKVSSQQIGVAVSSEVEPPSPTKIFISYSRKQLGIARRLAEDLQQAGFAVWWDVSDLKGGAEWEKAIEAAIKTSQYCLILLTPDSVESVWVRKEYMYAISLHLQVIPILYRDCKIPLALTTIQYLDFRGNKYKQGLKELLATLESATVTSKPIHLTLKDRLLALARDRMWQMIGAIIALIVLTWAVYTFSVNVDGSGPATATATLTHNTVTTIAAAPKVTNISTPIVESTLANTLAPTPTLLDSRRDTPTFNTPPSTRTLTLTVLIPRTLTSMPVPTRTPVPLPTGVNGFEHLTTGNSIVLGYSITGKCGSFNPEGRLIATTAGVYDVATGIRRFPIYASDYSSVGFSPNGELVAAGDDGLYGVTTGERRFQFSSNFATFNPDSTLLAVGYPESAVFDVVTGAPRFNFVSGSAFSPDGRWLAGSRDVLGTSTTYVYDVATGQERFRFSGYSPTFSPDSTFLAVGGDAVYELATGERLINDIKLDPAFNPDSTLLAVWGNDTVYELPSGVPRFRFDGQEPVFSPDGKLLAVADDGVYEVPSGAVRFKIGDGSGSPIFSPDGKLLAVADDGVYDTTTSTPRLTLVGYSQAVFFSPDTTLLLVATGSSCLVYGSVQNQWPYRSGVIQTEQRVNVYDSPSDDAIAIGSFGGEAIVLTRTTDHLWYKVSTQENVQGWVPASAIRIVAAPDELPIETK